jgi:hypothetical protein
MFNRSLKEEINRLREILDNERIRSGELSRDLYELKGKQQTLTSIVDNWRERDRRSNKMDGIEVTVKSAPPGSLLLLDNGTVILKSEYNLAGTYHPMAIIEGTGEYYHGDIDRKGRIIDMGSTADNSQESDPTLSANERALALVSELKQLWNNISIDTMYDLESNLAGMMYEDDLSLKEPEGDLTKDLPSFDDRAEAFRAELKADVSVMSNDRPLTEGASLGQIKQPSNETVKPFKPAGGGYQPVFTVGKPMVPPKDE